MVSPTLAVDVYKPLRRTREDRVFARLAKQNEINWNVKRCQMNRSAYNLERGGNANILKATKIVL